MENIGICPRGRDDDANLLKLSCSKSIAKCVELVDETHFDCAMDPKQPDWLNIWEVDTATALDGPSRHRSVGWAHPGWGGLEQFVGVATLWQVKQDRDMKSDMWSSRLWFAETVVSRALLSRWPAAPLHLIVLFRVECNAFCRVCFPGHYPVRVPPNFSGSWSVTSLNTWVTRSGSESSSVVKHRAAHQGENLSEGRCSMAAVCAKACGGDICHSVSLLLHVHLRFQQFNSDEVGG